GYGESMMRLNDLKIIARHIKETGGRVRVNTNGHANLIYRRNVAPELEGLVDVISISLNESSAEKYEQVCHPRFGLDTYYSILNFAKECKLYIPKVILSVVDVISEEDIDMCRKMADNLDVEFRVRESI
ncbi:MAG: TatD family nuclease-associated radical SAM protein, partial [Christensenellales bacterium]